MTSKPLTLVSQLERYARRFPEEMTVVERFQELLARYPNCFERDCWAGHVTGSAWLVDPSGRDVLLTHHRKLGIWLQLGGHSDGDPETAAVALREAEEESGLEVELLWPIFSMWTSTRFRPARTIRRTITSMSGLR